MLVLSRKPGERIRIGDEIFVEIRRVDGNRVTVAIDAPRHVHILRGELERFADEFGAPSPDQDQSEAYRAEYFRVPRPQSNTRRRVQAASA